MAKYYVNKNLSPIIYQMSRLNLTKSDLCTYLDISLETLNNWIHNPGLIRFKDLLILSGLFGIPIEEFVYILVRNKPKIKGKNKSFSDSSKWYLEGIRERVDNSDNV